MVIIAISTYPMESTKEVAKRLMAHSPLPTYITMKGPYTNGEVGVGVKVIAIYEFDKSKYSEAFEVIFARYAKYLGVPGFTYSINTWVEAKEAIKLAGMG
jgi:hypothetical protein